jgi:transcription-repair coupling factor (superfamily II helicase)
LSDIFGKPPASVANLLTIALFKNLAGKHGATRITLKRAEYSIGFDKLIDASKTLQNTITQGKVVKSTALSKIIFKDAKEMLQILKTFD